MTADLIFYKESFGGNCKIPAAKYPLWEKRAGIILEKITGGKSIAHKDDERVKMCICEIAECIYEESKRRGIVSENNDGYSVRYENRDTKAKVNNIAALWLSGTNLLYRGVECES